MQDPGIAVVGAGAVGSLLMAALVTNGRNVHWVEHSEQRRRQLVEPCVAVDGELRKIDPAQIILYSAIEELPAEIETVFVAVKSYHVGSVVAALSGRRHILVVANGLLQGEFNLGLLYGGGRISQNGQADLMAENRLFLGPLPGAAPLPFTVAESLTVDWLEVFPEEDIRVRMFHKLALNCAINPLTAIYDLPNGQLPLSEAVPLMTALLSEIDSVARYTLGNTWQYNIEILLQDCLDLLDQTAPNSSSMREDLHHQRRTEITALNLAITELAAELGLDCPCNRYMGNMICLLTNSFAL